MKTGFTALELPKERSKVVPLGAFVCIGAAFSGLLVFHNKGMKGNNIGQFSLARMLETTGEHQKPMTSRRVLSHFGSTHPPSDELRRVSCSLHEESHTLPTHIRPDQIAPECPIRIMRVHNQGSHARCRKL